LERHGLALRESSQKLRVLSRVPPLEGSSSAYFFIWAHGFMWIRMDLYAFAWIYIDLYCFTLIHVHLLGFILIYIDLERSPV
jgi:hypothetical protein